MKCYFCNNDILVRHTQYIVSSLTWFTGTCFNHKFRIIQSRFNTINYPIKSIDFEFSTTNKLIIDFRDGKIGNCLYYCNKNLIEIPNEIAENILSKDISTIEDSISKYINLI